jgi:2,4-dienoyl-CoA reductase (NADPH2)
MEKMKLFEPIAIRSMELKNRIVMAPMVTGFRIRNEIARAYYQERARGGVGSMIIGGLQVDALIDKSVMQGLRSWLIDPVHKYEVKIGPQLMHGNRYPSFGNSFFEWVAPSPGSRLRAKELSKSHYKVKEFYCRELSFAEIKDIISKYAMAAFQAKQVGFDFVEVYACHGPNLPQQFFSPLDNHRLDKYGGNLKGRMCFSIELAEAVRRLVGDDYPFFWRLSAEEDWPGGIILEDSVELALELTRVGVDVIDVSYGREIPYDVKRTGNVPPCPTKKHPMGTFVYLAEIIKRKVGVPVISVGRINKPRVAEAILNNGIVDLVALGRQLLCDPFWPQKAAEGRVSEIIVCKSCNHCLRQFRSGLPISCKQNDRLGREWQFAPEE